MSMSRVCGRPGCPNLFDAVPNRYYCDVHTDGGNLEQEYSEEVKETLIQMISDAGHGQNKNDEWHRQITSEINSYVPAIQDAIANGEIWTAVRHALWVGRMSGLGQGAPSERELGLLRPWLPKLFAFRKAQSEKALIKARYEREIAAVHSTLRKEMITRRAKGEKRAEIVKHMAKRNRITRRHVQNIVKGIS